MKSKNRERVVVTGLGVVSPIGKTVESFWRAALSGQSGIKKISKFFVPKEASQIAGIIEDEHADSADVFSQYGGEDRTAIFAKDAILQACQDAKINIDTLGNSKNIHSLVLSSAVAAISSMERHFIQATNAGKYNISKSSLSPSTNYFEFNYINDYITSQFPINGRSLLIPTGCVGCLDAIAYSTQIIRDGFSDVVITGASEAPITPLVVAAFNRIGATSTQFNHSPTKASRPFDKNRDGFVLAEGCGIIILESLTHAKERGAKIYAEISGVSSANNCFHMTNIPEDGKAIAKVCLEALEDALCDVSQIDHINAHGSSTEQNDIAETNAFKTVFGSRYREISVTSNKSFLGHALSASNALETILAIKTLNESVIPPTINLELQDERCNLSVVANRSQRQNINKILKNSSGFSGIHSALIIEKYKEYSDAN